MLGESPCKLYLILCEINRSSSSRLAVSVAVVCFKSEGKCITFLHRRSIIFYL